MNIINWILNIACVFLWIDWRSGRTGRPQSVLSIASALRSTARDSTRGLGSVAALMAILFFRPFVYYSIGFAIIWTVSLNFLAVAIPWHSDLLSRMFLFSPIRSAITLGISYSWLLLLAAVNRPTGTAAAEEVMHRLIRGQLGLLFRIPWLLKPLLPSFIAAISWMALNV